MMKRRGFTLVEFLIVMTAGVAVAVMIFVMFGPIENWVFTQRRRIGMNANTAAVTRVMKEVRRVKAPNQISAFTSGHLRFTDIDNNGIDFQLSGSDLVRNSIALARNVSGLTFTYLDMDGNVATQNQGIRVIRVRLETISGDQTIYIESAARIRNL